MTTPDNTQQQDNRSPERDKNFRILEEKFQREKERAEKLEAELKARQASVADDDDDTDEPYVDHKKLNKKLAKHGQQVKAETQTEIQKAVNMAIAEERKQNWLKQNGDFFEVLKHADKLAVQDPELADTILSMPEGFERQKLVYKNIKMAGLDKPAAKEKSIQEKIDANRKSPYYQPSGVGTAPYGAQGDFSPAGQKNAYEQLLKLKANLRI